MRTAHNIIQEYFPELQEDLTTEDYSKIEQAINAARKDAIDEVVDGRYSYFDIVDSDTIFVDTEAIGELKNSMK